MLGRDGQLYRFYPEHESREDELDAGGATRTNRVAAKPRFVRRRPPRSAAIAFAVTALVGFAIHGLLGTDDGSRPATPPVAAPAPARPRAATAPSRQPAASRPVASARAVRRPLGAGRPGSGSVSLPSATVTRSAATPPPLAGTGTPATAPSASSEFGFER